MDPSADPRSQASQPSGGEDPREAWRRVHLMTQLLDQAARTVWARVDRDGPASPLLSFGLGIHLAHGQVLLLLPSDLGTAGTDDDLGVDAFDERTTAQLLADAEKLSHALLLSRFDLLGGSQLVVVLCDLIREAEHLGY